MKVVIINNIISPYIIPLLNSLSRADGIDLHVIFLAERDANRAWQIYRDEIHFSCTVLKSINFFVRKFDAPFYFHWGLWSELRRLCPDVLCICGYHYAATWEVILYARCYYKKTVLWAGSHLLSGNFKNPATDYYKRRVIPCFDAYITYGTAARDQILFYGADSRKIVIGCNTVDVEFFINEAYQCRAQRNDSFLGKFPIRRVLYVGDLIPRKGVNVLIKAFEMIQKRDNNICLIIIGDGPERIHLANYICAKNIKNVFLENFIHKKNIVRYYAAADVFVLPSFKEVWGLVVNEAMACGLPVICSKYAGVTKDLVLEGKNGFSFDPYDVDDLVRKLLVVLSDEMLREQMGRESLKLISQRDINYYANNILDAIKLSIKSGS